MDCSDVGNAKYLKTIFRKSTAGLILSKLQRLSHEAMKQHRMRIGTTQIHQVDANKNHQYRIAWIVYNNLDTNFRYLNAA